MSNEPKATAPQQPAFDSTYGHDRWQGPTFAASWISPPAPTRSFADDATAPHRDDDHA